MNYQYFEAIPTMCGMAFALEGMTPEDTKPAHTDTRKEIEDEIKDCQAELPDYDGFPLFGYLEGDFVVECDEETTEVIHKFNWRENT